MDTTVRLFTKSLTWQLAGLVSMVVIGYLFTGSLVAGGSIAIVGSLTGFVSYFLHELVWSKIKWGQYKTDQVR